MTSADDVGMRTATAHATGRLELVPISRSAEQSGLVARTDLIEHVLALVQLQSNVLLFGPDGSGRTAVLHEAVERLGQEGATVARVDGAGVYDPVQLIGLVLRPLGLIAPRDVEVPYILAAVQPDPGCSRVIAIDDLEIEPAQLLFGRWRRHLWRLGARWIAIGSGDDPTAYLDAGADAWWEDGVLPVMPLQRSDARDVVSRYLNSVGVTPDNIPEALYAGTGGLPRELLRRARALALESVLASTRSVENDGRGFSSWSEPHDQPVPHELSPQETTLMSLVRERGSVSLANHAVLTELGWSYGKTHRVANELVARGVLERSEVAGEVGRPRVVYAPAGRQ